MLPGTTIAGKYELVGPIAEGGMGSVWRARQLALDRMVAVKFIRSDLPRGEIAQRFSREARIAARIQHRNVVDVLDYGTSEDGTPYLVMELLQGQGFGDWLRTIPPPGRARIVEMMMGALGGLSAVHDAGVVHRDLKPDNIFLSQDADGLLPKIVDFGIARSTAATALTESVGSLTRTGSIVGTPVYMSPEQVRAAKDIDARTDVYSMGVILYEALSGRLPFDAESFGDLIIAIATQDPPPLLSLAPEVGQSLAQVIHRAIARDRNDRFPHARELRQALLTASKGQGLFPQMPSEVTGPVPVAVIRPTPPTLEAAAVPPGEVLVTTVGGQLPPPRRSGRLLLGGSAAALLLVIGVGTALWGSADPPTTSGPGAPVAAPRQPAAGAGQPVSRAVEDSPAPPARPVVTPVVNPPGESHPTRPDVTVRLEHLPPGARIRLDDVAVDGPDVMMPRDGQEHAIEVEAADHRSWRRVHLAVADAAYDVELGAAPHPTGWAPVRRTVKTAPRRRANKMLGDPGF